MKTIASCSLVFQFFLVLTMPAFGAEDSDRVVTVLKSAQLQY